MRFAQFGSTNGRSSLYESLGNDVVKLVGNLSGAARRRGIGAIFLQHGSSFVAMARAALPRVLCLSAWAPGQRQRARPLSRGESS